MNEAVRESRGWAVSGWRPPAGMHSLLWKMALTIAGVALFAGGIAVYAGGRILTATFTATESGLVLRNRAVLSSVIDKEVAHLETAVRDWSQWDELHAYALGRDPGFAPRILGPVVLDDLKIDALVVLDTAGRLRHADVRDGIVLAADPLGHQSVHEHARRHDGDLLGALGKALGGGPGSGLLDSAAGPVIIAVAPILASDGGGEVAGGLAFIRRLPVEGLAEELHVLPSRVFLHGSVVSRMSDDAHVIARRVAGEPGGAWLDIRSRDISDYQLFRDIFGAPAFLIETRMPRTVLAAGQHAARQLFLLGIAVVSCLCLLLLFLLRHIILQPITELTGHLLAIQDGEVSGLPPGRDKNDEIGMLAREFAAMMQARDAVHARLSRVVAAVDNAGDAIALLDADERIVYANPQFERLSGLPAAAIIGERLAGTDEAAGSLWETVRGGARWTGVLTRPGIDGGERHGDVTVAPVKDDCGAITSYVAVVRDITRRLKTEASLRNLATAVESAADGIVVLSVSGVVEYVNAAYARARGCAPDALVGRLPQYLLDGIEDLRSHEAMWMAIRAGRPWAGRTTTRVPGQGTVTEDAVLSPVHDGGVVTGFVMILHDVTQRIRLEEELAHARRLESIAQLAAGIAHEINTPVQYVGDNLRFLDDAFSGIAALLDELVPPADGDDEQGHAVPAGGLGLTPVAFLRREIPPAIRQSLDGLRRVDAIVQSMGERVHPDGQTATVDLDTLVREAIDMTAATWRPVATLEFDAAPDSATPRGVPAALSQVLVNLIVNAAHAVAACRGRGEAVPGRIHVSTWVGEGEAGFSVTDNGTGMTAAVRERIFEPFYTTKPLGEGTGQGLAIVHRIVTGCGGTITVDTAPGRGARFNVRVPVQPAPGGVVARAGGDIAAA